MPDTRASKRSYESLLGYILSRASALMDRQFVGCLKAQGLTLPAWRVVAVLSKEPELPVNRLAKKALLNQPTLTAIVDKLERRGLLRRRASTKDRRVFLVSLSKPGRKVVEELLEDAARIEARDLDGYSAQDKRRLKEGLLTLITRLERNAG